VARYFEEPRTGSSSARGSESAGIGAAFHDAGGYHEHEERGGEELVVRAPDSSKRERLIGGPPSSSSAASASRGTHLTSEFLRERTAEMQRAMEMVEPGVSWMFTLPPDYPVCPLLLREVIEELASINSTCA
jgi:hypothetical protein